MRRMTPDDGPYRLSPAPGELYLQPGGLPSWWGENGNILLSAIPDASHVHITGHPGLALPTNTIVFMGCIIPPAQLMIWGDGGMIYLGHGSRLPSAILCCGGGATIAINDGTSSSGNAAIDARNGGLVRVGSDGLWAAETRMNSDDMHAIRDASGKRLNPFGGRVIIGDHVWLGFQSLCLSGANVGSGSVIGARSLVRKAIPPQAVAAGSPARVVRNDITWHFEDAP